MNYRIAKVDGIFHAGTIHRLNNLFPDQFDQLKPRHLREGHWWLAYDGNDGIAAFAGMVQFLPRLGYFKRAAVLENHRGRGLQPQLMAARELYAREHTDWLHLVSDTSYANIASANNFIRAGFELFEPDRPWEKDALFWIKSIA